MFEAHDMFAIVTFLIVGLLGVLGLLVVYVARIVKYMKQMATPFSDLVQQGKHAAGGQALKGAE